MSDASEVKQSDIHIHHQSGKAFILVELHDRIVADLKAEVRAARTLDALVADNAQICEQYDEIEKLEATIAELKAEVERLKRANQIVPRDAELLASNGKFRDTIATQARVIEKLKEQRSFLVSVAHCGEILPDDTREKMNQELAAIEKEGAKDD